MFKNREADLQKFSSINFSTIYKKKSQNFPKKLTFSLSEFSLKKLKIFYMCL